MSETILQFPTRLEKLAVKIHQDIDRRGKTDADWVEATLDLCADLYDARCQHPSNAGFGVWFDAGGFKLSADERAAAIAMGEDMNTARLALEKTESRSLRHIRYEFDRLRSATKTDDTKKKQTRRGGRRVNGSPKYDRAMEAVAALAAAGEEITVAKVMKAADVGKTVAEKACLVHETREALVPHALPEGPLSVTAAQRLEAKLKAHQRELNARFDAAVSAACVAWSEEHGISRLMEKLDAVERAINTPRGSVMQKDEYFILSRCVHTDTARTRTDEQLNEAFNILRKYRLKLINDEEERIAIRRELRSNMPKTVEEMLARKRTGKRGG